MNFFKKNNGTVTIFLVIILVPIIVITTLFIDVSRIQLSQGLAYSAADLSLNTVLTQYDKELSDYYGMMASCQTIDEFYDVAEDYFIACMVSQGIDTTDAQRWGHALGESIFGGDTINDFLCMELEETTVSVEDMTNADLANAAMVKEEIADFMKYRAPADLVADAVDGISGGGLVTKLTNVQKNIENMPAETLVQNDKVKYYEAENELLQYALEIYEILVEYEAINVHDERHTGTYFDKQYLEETMEDMQQLPLDYETLHTLYVSQWCNSKDCQSVIKSVATQVSEKGGKTLSGGPYERSTVKSAINTCESKYNDYMSAKEKLEEKLAQEKLAFKDVSRINEVNHIQYWVQMANGLGDTYQKYVDALVAFDTAYQNMVEAYSDRKPEHIKVGTETTHDPITGESHTKDIYEDQDFADKPLAGDGHGGPTFSEKYGELTGTAGSEWSSYKNHEIYEISKYVQMFSEEGIAAKATDRSKAEEEIQTAVANLNKEYQILVTARDYLLVLQYMLPELKGKIDDYESAFNQWEQDTDANSDKDSSLIEENAHEIAVLNGEEAEDGGEIIPARSTIKDTDLSTMQTKISNALSLIDSFMVTMESYQYRGIGVVTTENQSGINSFSVFDATARGGISEAPSVDINAIPVYQTELDAYIAETWDMKDAYDGLMGITSDNRPDLHEYGSEESYKIPVEGGQCYAIDTWLHDNFDGIDTNSQETSDVLSNLMEMVKNLASNVTGTFGQYDNSHYVNDDLSVTGSDLPSEGGGEETDVGDTYELEEGEVDDELDQVNEKSDQLFGGIDFGSLFTGARDDLYATTYIMNMFSYETTHLEAMYHRERGDTPVASAVYDIGGITINPGNAHTLFDTEASYAWWEDDAPTFTENKTMTNKPYMFTYRDGEQAYGSEVEYILFGGDTDSNKAKMATTLLFTRYAFNLAPVSMRYWNDKTVVTLATAISTATAGVVPAPLVQAVVCLGICAAESAVDVNYLKAGLPVAFVKAKDNIFVKLSVEGAAEDVAEGLKSGVSQQVKIGLNEKMDTAAVDDDSSKISLSKDTGSGSGVDLNKNTSSGVDLNKNTSSGVNLNKDTGIDDTKLDTTKPTTEAVSVQLPIYFFYSDYLSLYLFIGMMASEDNIYLRAADVMQVNMANNSELDEEYAEFNMSNAKKYFTLDYHVKVRPMMITTPLAQDHTESLLDTDTWNTFSYTMTRGY